MATTDIPEFVEVAPGDLIRAEDLNTIQREARNSVRTHRHTRVAGTPIDDTATEDRALQITTDELADGAVTGAKLSSDAIPPAVIPDGAVTGPKLAAGAVTADKLAAGSVGAAAIQNGSVGTDELGDDAVRFNKIAVVQVRSGTVTVAPNGTVVQTVQANVPNPKQTLFFPTLTTTQTTGILFSLLSADIIYAQAAGAGPVDVMIRVTNSGSATGTAIWFVWTFAT